MNAVYVAGIPVPLLDSDEGYPALQLANQVLGGGASSRLWMRLREKEGLSYGTGSGLRLRALDRAGVLSLSVLFNPQNASKLKAAAEEAVRKLLTEGPSAAELDAARDEYLRGRTLSRTDDGVLAGMLAGQLYLGRTMQFEADLEQKIRALTRDQDPDCGSRTWGATRPADCPNDYPSISNSRGTNYFFNAAPMDANWPAAVCRSSAISRTSTSESGKASESSRLDPIE